MEEEVMDGTMYVKDAEMKFNIATIKSKWPYLGKRIVNNSTQVRANTCEPVIMDLTLKILHEDRVPEEVEVSEEEALKVHALAKRWTNPKVETVILRYIFTCTAFNDMSDLMHRVWKVSEGENINDVMAKDMKIMVMSAFPAEYLDQILASTEKVMTDNDLIELLVQWKLLHPTNNGRDLDRLLLHVRYDVLPMHQYPHLSDRADLRMTNRRLKKNYELRCARSKYNKIPLRLPKEIDPLYRIMLPDYENKRLKPRRGMFCVDFKLEPHFISYWKGQHTVIFRHNVTVGPYACSIMTSYGQGVLYGGVTIDYRLHGNSNVSLKSELEKKNIYIHAMPKTECTQWNYLNYQKVVPATDAIPTRINNQGAPDWRNAKPVIHIFSDKQALKLIPVGQWQVQLQILFDVVITKDRKENK